MVDIAREIRDGKLTGKVYSPIVLTGYVPQRAILHKHIHLHAVSECLMHNHAGNVRPAYALIFSRRDRFAGKQMTKKSLRS